MPLSFTEAYKEALASAPTDITTIDTIEVSHPLFPSSFYFARSERDETFDGQVYIGKQFSYKFPQVSERSNASLDITISRVPLSSLKFIDLAAQSLDPISVLFKSWIICVAGPQAQYEAALESNGISLNNSDLVISAGYPDMVNLKVPTMVYTTELFPGIR